MYFLVYLQYKFCSTVVEFYITISSHLGQVRNASAELPLAAFMGERLNNYRSDWIGEPVTGLIDGIIVVDGSTESQTEWRIWFDLS